MTLKSSSNRRMPQIIEGSLFAPKGAKRNVLAGMELIVMGRPAAEYKE